MAFNHTPIGAKIYTEYDRPGQQELHNKYFLNLHVQYNLLGILFIMQFQLYNTKYKGNSLKSRPGSSNKI